MGVARVRTSDRPFYRPEIDGLRAFAVLPVILFHAGFSPWAGGYVGVDVFFVISGYLITGILIGDLRAGRFSIVRFYERRARRILPALFFVLAVSCFFAWLWMLPSQLITYGLHLAAVATFCSNVVLWLSTDYFAPASELLPLLHTWSLAVEEQFYLAFPPLFYLGWRLGPARLAWVMGGVALLSLGFSCWATGRYPALDFYLPPSRIWELLAGALCALVPTHRRLSPSGGLAALGLALVIAPVFLFEAGTPSWFLTLPVAGAALIILFAGGRDLATSLLRARPFVWIGLISYSAYLWHQPLFAFARIRLPSDPTPVTMALLSVLSILLAYPTWRWVEQPMRAGGSTFFATRRPLFVFSGVGLVATLGFGAALIALGGVPSRVPEAVLRIDAAREDVNPLTPDCHLSIDLGMTGRTHPIASCLTGPGDAPPVVLIGDSHANALSWEVRRAVEGSGLRFYGVTMSSCPPIAGLIRIGGTNLMACDSYVRGMRDYAARSGAGVVVLAARWQFSIDGTKFDNGEGGRELGDNSRIWDLADGDTAGLDAKAATPILLNAFVDDIKALLASGVKVVLVYPIPEAGWNVPDRLSRITMASGGAPDLSTDPAAYLARNRAVIDAFDAIQSPNLYRVRPDEALCDTVIPGRCANSLGETVLYRDENHVTNAGARLIAPAVLTAIERAQAAR